MKKTYKLLALLSLLNVGVSMAQNLEKPFTHTPLNGAVDVELKPTFKWKKVVAATSYQLKLYKSDSTLVLDSLLQDTTFKSPILEENSHYSWILRAQNDVDVSEYTAISTFTTRALVAPSTPTAISPIGTITKGVFSYQTFSFSAVTIASKYHIQVATDSLFEKKIINDSSLTSNNYYSFNIQDNTNYFWRIAASNSYGKSEFSETNSFIIPGQITIPEPRPDSVSFYYPKYGSSNIEVNPTISWSKVKNASYYIFELSDSIANIILIDTISSLESMKILSNLKFNHIYKVIVTAYDQNNIKGGLTHLWFTTEEALAPIPPVLVTSNGTVFGTNTNPVLIWQPVSGATSYCIQVSKDSSFTQLITNACNVTATSYTVKSDSLVSARMEETSDKTYFWRISASNASAQGVWSKASTYSLSVLTANEESSLSNTISLFPNPVVDILTISGEIEFVNVKNASGSVVVEGNTNTIDMTNVSAGLYFVEFKTKTGFKQIVKVVKVQ